MEFLTALLAFAAVMALMSTIVAVVIEAAINLLGMRSRGLKALLAQYYRDAVAPRLPAGSGLRGNNAEARAFASEVTSNPARLPGAMRSGARRYNRLTVRQLIEQLARTPAGQAFLKLPDSQLKPHLEALSYEFDRFSEGARDFFTRRTRNTGVTIALILAFGLNVDALRLYRVLATDGDTRDRVVALMADVQVANANIEQAVAQREAGRPAAPPPTTLEFGQDPRTGAELTAEQAEQQLRENERRIDELLTLLANMSIPIGVTQYPYCSRYSPLLGHVVEGEAVFDGRCKRVRQYEQALDAAAGAPVAARSDPDEGPSADEVQSVRDSIGGLAPLLSWVGGEPAARWIVLRTHPDSLLWVFSVLIAGGMIGLGAPFWFNVYRRLGLLIPIVGAAQAMSSRSQQTQDGTTVQTTADEGRRDDVNVRGGNNLVVTLRTAAGGSPVVDDAAADPAAPDPSGAAPPGMAVGPGSAQRVASATGGGASRGMRRLRG
jgi:hypothetical protein